MPPSDAPTPADILPDEILDKHLGGGADDTGEDDHDEPQGPAPDDEDDGENDDTDDIPQGDADDDDLDADDDEEGGDDEPDDDPDEDDTQEEEGGEDADDSDEDDVLDEEVTAEERARIQKDPALRKLHKEMQRSFTKKTTEVARRNRELDARETRAQEFETRLSTPEGIAGYLQYVLERNPAIVGSAFEVAATGEAGYDFLVEVGLHDPELFEKAAERLRELESDEEERTRHTRDRDLRTREAQLAQQEQRRKRERFDQAVTSLEESATAFARRLQIHSDDMDTVKEKLKARIRERRRDDGSVDLSDSDVKALVQEAKKEIDRVYARVQEKLDRKRVSDSQAATKRRAQKGKKPNGRQPPRATATRRPGPGPRFKPSKVGDPLDDFVDHRLASI